MPMHLNDTLPDVKTAQDFGLSSEEFDKIKALLGRSPNLTELRIFAVMWSEQASGKNSATWLRTMPKEGKQLLIAAGRENAGLLDIGGGLACAFKIEPCNHASATNPYHGAASGASRIQRDIFTMGARPVASLNLLCLGQLDDEHTQQQMREVVKGIGDYNNCLGVPTVGGEAYFDQSFSQSPVVNIMSVGIVKAGEALLAKVSGPGNAVFIVGPATGGSNLPGDANSIAISPVDPFQGRLLLEVILEAVPTKAIVGMQNIAIGGIAGAAAEMSTNISAGMHIDLDQVEICQPGMQPFEILLSESPERILLVTQKGKENLLIETCEKWDLNCNRIGEVTDNGKLAFFCFGEKVVEIPARTLIKNGGAPVYERSFKRPAYLKRMEQFSINKIKPPHGYPKTARQVFFSPNVVSRKWLSEQFDSTVQANNLSANRATDAALVRIPGDKKALALTIDCNSFYTQADPYLGAMIAVSEAARNIVCCGGEPLALSTCLNVGNPNDPEVYWQFVNAIKGISEACRKLGVPVSSSNASFYNQTCQKDKNMPIHPTPAIGMVGLVEDCAKILTFDFKKGGHQIYMIGTPQNDLNCSEYLRIIHGEFFSPPPVFDLDEEYHIQRNLKTIIRNKLIESAHDISEGGLFACLMKCAMVNNLGFDIESDTNFRKDAYLFGESQSRIVVTTAEENEDELVNSLNSNNVPFTKLGEVTGQDVIIDGENFGPVSQWKERYEHFISQKLDQ